VDSEEIRSNGSLDIAVRVFSSISKVPFITGRLQFNTSSLHAIDVECLVWSFRKFSKNEARMPSQNMCSSLLADDK